jgi:hypothetical protein
MTPFFVDLTAHEGRRLAAVLAAMPGWDPAVVLADETRAQAMLYSDLDAGQQATLAQLREAGVLA